MKSSLKEKTKESTNKVKQSTKKGLKKGKEKTKKGYQKTKEGVKKGKEKINQVRQSSAWQKTKKVAGIIGSHLAFLKTSITLSNEEAKLLTKLKNDLKNKNVSVSKSEIFRAALWSLRNKKLKEVEEMVKDLVKINQMKFL